MADSADANREALRVATFAPRYRLLKHAATYGSFRASQAAGIAELPASSGTARSTHAGALVCAGLLERTTEGVIEYRVTDRGLRFYTAIAGLLEEESAPRVTDHQLRAGESMTIDLVERAASRRRRKITLEIRRPK